MAAMHAAQAEGRTCMSGRFAEALRPVTTGALHTAASPFCTKLAISSKARCFRAFCDDSAPEHFLAGAFADDR